MLLFILYSKSFKCTSFTLGKSFYSKIIGESYCKRRKSCSVEELYLVLFSSFLDYSIVTIIVRNRNCRQNEF